MFVRSGAAWSQQAELTASDGFSFDRFGTSVAISGPTVVVGAFGHNNQTGAAYVFVRSGTAWHQQAELTASDAQEFDNFGNSVAISGSTVVVGAEAKHDFIGAAYVFVRSGTAWHQQIKRTASDGKRSSFGNSVAISRSTVVVGAEDKNSNTGAAYVFVRTGKAWSQQARLTAADAAQGSDFGYSVAVCGPAVVVGATHISSTDTGGRVRVRAHRHGLVPAGQADRPWPRHDRLLRLVGGHRRIDRGGGRPRPDLARGGVCVRALRHSLAPAGQADRRRRCLRRLLRRLGGPLGIDHGRRRPQQQLGHRGGLCVRERVAARSPEDLASDTATCAVTDRWSTRWSGAGPDQRQRSCSIPRNTLCWAWRASCHSARSSSRCGRELA